MAADKIKIFVDAHCFDKEYQGTQTFIRELYTRLITDYPGIDIYFGARNVANIGKNFPALPAANILPYKKRSSDMLRFLFDIPAYIKHHKFHFAHFQYISPIKIAGCKYIVTTHDILFNDYKKDFSYSYRFSRNILFGNCLKSAAIGTTVSAYSKNRICDYYDIAQNNVHIIANGVNNALIDHQSSKQEAAGLIAQKFGVKNYILYVSRLEPRKNHFLLLKTYLKLKLYEQGIVLVFIGKKSIDTPRLTMLIDNLTSEQKKYFFWIEQTEQADLAAFYRACRVFVYPSKAEGFGIPPLEAAICQAPVLCSSVTAMEDFKFFEPYTFDPADEKVFEQKLLQMLEHPPAPEFIHQVATQVQQQYNWQTSSNLFFNLIQANYTS